LGEGRDFVGVRRIDQQISCRPSRKFVEGDERVRWGRFVTNLRLRETPRVHQPGGSSSRDYMRDEEVHNWWLGAQGFVEEHQCLESEDVQGKSRSINKHNASVALGKCILTCGQPNALEKHEVGLWL